MMSWKNLLVIPIIVTVLLSAQAEYVNDWAVGETTWHLAAPADWEGGIFDPMSESWRKPPYPPSAIITGVRTTAATAEHLIVPQYALWLIHSDPAYHDPHGSVLVTTIRSSAFANWKALKMISVPYSVTTIGIPCFRGCSNLTDIKVTNGSPYAETEVELDAQNASAFGSTYITKDGVLYDRDMKRMFKYPEGRVGSFYTVPSSVTSLATGCLAGTKLRGVLFEGDCPNVTSVAFTDSTCAIYRYSDATGWPVGANAYWCGRPVISVPRSMMETISSTNLYGKVTRHEYHYEIFDGMLCKYEKEKRLRDESYEYYGVTLCSVSPVYGEVKLPDVLGGLPVVRIGEAAMKSHNNMTSVEIPSTVEEIGSSAFDTCTRLQMVEFPRKLKAIGSRAFSQCVALTSVVLPEGLESIAYRAFSSCHSLNSIKLPDSLFKVEKEAFIYSENILNTEAMPGLITVDGWIVGPGDDFPGGTLDLHGARGLLPGAFENCETLKRVVMAPEIRIISDNAFYNCTNLESVVFCEGLEQIGEDAFAHTAIREAILPDGCGEIDLDIFRSSRIEYLRVPSSSGIKGTGYVSYCGLGGLKTLDYAAREMEEWAFANADSLVNVILRNGVEKICDCAFADCNELKVIVVPPSVTEFDGVAVFEGTGQHVTMYLPTTLRDYIKKNENAYTFCESYTTIFYNPEDFHYVTFDTAGGSMEAPDYITVGGKLWQYPEPRLAKHSFLGWFTEREGGTKVAPSAKITSDMTLYAHWLYDGSAMVNVECGYAFTGGNKLCKAGEKVNLKVMASIVHVTHIDSDGVVTKWDEVFAGWYQDGEPLVSDSDYRSPSLVYVAKGESDVTIEGRYVLLAEDAARLSVANIAAGETFVVNGSWTKKVEIDSYSIPSVSVKGLPAGLKFDAKTLTISGKPTKPGTYVVELSLKNASVKTAKNHTFKIIVPNLESGRITGGVSYKSDAYTYVAGTQVAPIIPALEDGWTLKASGLPSGLKLTGGKNGAPYAIEGAPTAKPGSYTVTLNLTKGKEKDVATITINIENRTLTLVMADCEGSHTNGCKVSGGGSYAAGKKVTLKATATAYKKATAKTPEQLATVFAGWYRDSGCRVPLEGMTDFRTTSYAYVTTAEDETIYAKFVPAADDVANLTIANIAEGEVFTVNGEWQKKIEVNSYSLPTVSVKGLPAGLKFDAKALTISGKPTKPGTYAVELSFKNMSVKTAKKHTFKIIVPNLESSRITGGVSYKSDAYTYVAGTQVAPILPVLEDGWTLKASGLPSGLKLTGGKNGAPYAIEGTPTAKPGSYTVTLNLTKGKEKDVATITVNIENRTLTLVVADCEGSHTNGCKVSGGGSYAAGKKVALKATATAYKKATAKAPEQLATVFAGWYRDSGCRVPLEGVADFRTTSYAYVTKAEDETIYAKFVPATADTMIGLVVNGEDVVDDSGDVRVVVKDAATLPAIELVSVSIPKVSVKGLPAGMKWDGKANRFTGAPTKPGIYKVSVSLTNTTVKKAIVRAFTVEVPNFVSPAFPGLKPESDAYPMSVGVSKLPNVDAGLAPGFDGYTIKVAGLPSGLSFKNGVLAGLAKKAGDYTVTFTATKGKDKQVSTITLHVEALPEWTVGTFVGMVRQIDRDEGGAIIEDEDGRHNWYDILTTVSVTSAGKVSGKMHFESGTEISFKYDSISERTDGGYLIRGRLTARGIAAEVELLLHKVWLESTGVGGVGVVDVMIQQTQRQEGKVWVDCEQSTFLTDEDMPLRQNVWTSKTLPLPPNINGDKETVTVGDDVYTLAFGKNGSVKVSLAKVTTPTKAYATGTATLSILRHEPEVWHCELCVSLVVKKNDYGVTCVFDVTISADGIVTCIPR